MTAKRKSRLVVALLQRLIRLEKRRCHAKEVRSASAVAVETRPYRSSFSLTFSPVLGEGISTISYYGEEVLRTHVARSLFRAAIVKRRTARRSPVIFARSSQQQDAVNYRRSVLIASCRRGKDHRSLTTSPLRCGGLEIAVYRTRSTTATMHSQSIYKEFHVSSASEVKVTEGRGRLRPPTLSRKTMGTRSAFRRETTIALTTAIAPFFRSRCRGLAVPLSEGASTATRKDAVKAFAGLCRGLRAISICPVPSFAQDKTGETHRDESGVSLLMSCIVPTIFSILANRRGGLLRPTYTASRSAAARRRGCRVPIHCIMAMPICQAVESGKSRRSRERL